jgi:hypothetical protein
VTEKSETPYWRVAQIRRVENPASSSSSYSSSSSIYWVLCEDEDENDDEDEFRSLDRDQSAFGETPYVVSYFFGWCAYVPLKDWKG